MFLTINNSSHFYNLSGYYANTRNDCGTFSPTNFLYTDNTGTLFSAPLSSISNPVHGPFTLADNQSSPADITGMVC